MDVLSFRAALVRCGLTDLLSQDSLIDQGYDNMVMFAVDVKGPTELKEICKIINKIPAVNGVKPRVTFSSMMNLSAMVYWTKETQRISFVEGAPVLHDLFTVAEMIRSKNRLLEEAEFKEHGGKVPTELVAFSGFGKKWRIFSEALKAYCKVVRGSMNLPLAYVLRDHEVVTNEMFEEEFNTTDAYLMKVVRLSGPEYKADNLRVWEIMYPFIVNTDAWSYVKGYEKSENARGAYLDLKRRGEGDAEIDARRVAAELRISKAQYTGQSQRHTLQHYIDTLQNAFTELSDCGEPYSERKKVDVLVNGLLAPRFSNACDHILGDQVKRLSFQESYAYLETLAGVRGDAGKDSFARKVSGLHQDEDVGKTWAYLPKKEFFKLSPEERKEHVANKPKRKGGDAGGTKKKKGSGKAAEANKKWKKSISGVAKGRKIEQLVTELVRTATSGNAKDDNSGSDHGSDGTSFANSSPSDQFGRNSRSVIRFAEEVLKAAGKSDDGGK